MSIPAEKGDVGNCAISQHPVTLIPMGHEIKARTHTSWEIAWFPTWQLLHLQEPRGTISRDPELASCYIVGIGSCYNLSEQWLHYLPTPCLFEAHSCRNGARTLSTACSQQQSSRSEDGYTLLVRHDAPHDIRATLRASYLSTMTKI